VAAIKVHFWRRLDTVFKRHAAGPYNETGEEIPFHQSPFYYYQPIYVVYYNRSLHILASPYKLKHLREVNVTNSKENVRVLILAALLSARKYLLTENTSKNFAHQVDEDFIPGF
jgi:hypothetical protein